MFGKYLATTKSAGFDLKGLGDIANNDSEADVSVFDPNYKQNFSPEALQVVHELATATGGGLLVEILKEPVIRVRNKVVSVFTESFDKVPVDDLMELHIYDLESAFRSPQHRYLD